MNEAIVMSPTPSDEDLDDSVPFRMNNRQSGALIASTIIGVGVLTLPRSTASYAAQNGWISALIGSVFAMLLLSLISTLVRRHPGMSMVGFTRQLLTPGRHKRIGLLLALPFLLSYALYWTSGTALVARIFGEVVTTTVLKRTPLEVIIGTMLITAFILVMHDIEVLVRVNEVLLPLIVIPLAIIGLSSLQSAQLVNLLPMFQVNWWGFLKGTALSTTSYLGFEMLMIFGAIGEQSGKPLRYHLLGVAVPGLVYSLIVFSGIAVFGVDELELLAWPTLELVKTTEVPGLILERLESAFLAVWVAAVFTTLGNLYYGTCTMLKEIMGLKHHRWIALALLPLFYWTSLQAPNVQVLFELMSRWDLFGLFNASVIPLFLLILSFMRRHGKETPHPENEANEDRAATAAAAALSDPPEMPMQKE
ncbi:spore germination protein [Paenibacillus phyllosphaerae]|uniref:Spore germination protein n=1 Tax=Paenibacillus phyllosphaerae TaxID=274593 RepID=A0A7W5B510_9BACL|nr:endospore germination permease [Paenibacillus phyllosphaerae]MBB3114513.1 spore germination protein [Paenibacillus phyllosphaerae]